MPRPRKGPRFGGSPSHDRKIMANLAIELFLHEKVTTTLPRAQAVRPLAEKLITKARKGDLHAERTVMRTIPNREAVVKLFDDVAPRYTDRQGGYTRITKLGHVVETAPRKRSSNWSDTAYPQVRRPVYGPMPTENVEGRLRGESENQPDHEDAAPADHDLDRCDLVMEEALGDHAVEHGDTTN